jgi:methylenetetrahydrofolate reductase (NADPH)
VLPLRGDPPKGEKEFVATPGGFRYASELVQFIREEDFNFCLGGACYPEGHVETASRDDDLRNLKAKVDAGLDFLITQLFFDNAFYFDFVERARRAGINVPIVPGIMPITNYEQVHRFTRMCGATVPMRLGLQLERVKDQPEAVVQLGVAHATVQCMELLARGVPGIHFYTLNKSPATRMIVGALRARS